MTTRGAPIVSVALALVAAVPLAITPAPVLAVAPEGREGVEGGCGVRVCNVARKRNTLLAVAPAAEALFQEGRRLLAAGRIDEACAQLAESYAIEASSGTLLNLALCHERQGKVATAWAEYRGASRLARDQGRADRAAVADEKVAALEAKLPRLTSIPTKPVPGMKLAIEDVKLGEGGLGVAVPVDPGRHEVKVSAPGYRPWAVTVDLKEGELRTLGIPPLEAEPLPAPTAVAMGAVARGADVAALGSRSPERSRLDLYLASGGGLLLVGGAASWTIAYARFQAAKDSCNNGAGCSEADRSSRISTITTLRAVAVGSWIAGGALLAVSGVHHWMTRNARAPANSMTLGLEPIGPIGGGLSLRGIF